MADTPITGLTELAETPNDSDVLEVVDVSDTTMNATGTNKKVSIANLLANAGGGGGGTLQGSAPSKVLIEEITLSSVGEFDFDNIPGDYDRLIIEGQVRGDVTGVAEILHMYMNGDFVSTNYYSKPNTVYGASNSDIGALAIPSIGWCSGDTSPANAYTAFEIIIEGYSNNFIKGWSSEFNTLRTAGSDIANGRTTGSHDSETDSITRLTIRTDNHPTDQLLGTLRLYGEKAISIEDSETITVKQKVETITDPTSGEFDFDLTNFQDGDRIIIEGEIRSSALSSVDSFLSELNGDSVSANYNFQQHYSLNGNTSHEGTTNTGANVGVSTADSSTAGMFSSIEIKIEGYSSSSKYKTQESKWSAVEGTSATIRSGQHSSVYNSSTDPITRIQIKTNNHPTDALTGTLTCYIEKQGVLPAINEVVSVAQTHGKVLIEEIELTTAGEFDFTNIPQDYDRLIIEGSARGDASLISDGLTCFVNDETTTGNYHRQNNESSNGLNEPGEAANANIAFITADSSPADSYATVSVSIDDYTGSNLKIIRGEFQAYSDTDIVKVGSRGVITPVTASITRLRFRTDNHPTDQLLGKLRLYGEKSIEIVDSETITVKEKVATITDPVSGEYDFDLTDFQDGDRIIVEGNIRGLLAATSDNVACYINEETTAADYFRQVHGAFDGATHNISGTSSSLIGTVVGANSPAGAVCSISMVIEKPFDDDVKNISSVFNAAYDTDKITMGNVSITSPVSSSVDRLRIRTDNHPTDKLEGTLTCYIEKQGVLPSHIPENNNALPSKVLLQEITNASGAYYDFDNLDLSSYDRVIIEGTIRENSTLDYSGGLLIKFNDDDTDANYHYVRDSTLNGVSNQAQGAARDIGRIQRTTSSDSYGPVTIVIDKPTGNHLKTAECEWGIREKATVELWVGKNFVQHQSMTDALTKISVGTSGAGPLFGTLRLYGERSISVVPSETITVKRKIETISLSSAGKFDFQNVPQNGKRIIIEGYVRSNGAGISGDNVYIYLNEDTTDANYWRQVNAGENGVSSVGESAIPLVGHSTGSSSPADSYAFLRLELDNYTSSNRKIIQAFNIADQINDSHMFTSHIGVRSDVVSAVNRIRLQTDNDPTDELTGELTLYIEEDGVLPMPEYKDVTLDMPVVQSATFDSTGTKQGESESGWLCTRVAVGTYDITFPTAAGTVTEQAVVAQWHQSGGATYEMMASVVSLTATTCRVLISSDAGVETDKDFSIIRRLPDKNVIAGGVLKTEGKHLIETIELTSGGEFDFQNIPQGYKRLIIDGIARSDVVDDRDSLYIYLNADETATNYNSEGSYDRSATKTQSSTNTAFAGRVSASSSPTGANGEVSIKIEGYDKTDNQKVLKCLTSHNEDGAIYFNGNQSVFWDTIESIDQVTVKVSVGNLTGALHLYGEN